MSLLLYERIDFVRRQEDAVQPPHRLARGEPLGQRRPLLLEVLPDLHRHVPRPRDAGIGQRLDRDLPTRTPPEAYDSTCTLSPTWASAKRYLLPRRRCLEQIHGPDSNRRRAPASSRTNSWLSSTRTTFPADRLVVGSPRGDARGIGATRTAGTESGGRDSRSVGSAGGHAESWATSHDANASQRRLGVLKSTSGSWMGWCVSRTRQRRMRFDRPSLARPANTSPAERQVAMWRSGALTPDGHTAKWSSGRLTTVRTRRGVGLFFRRPTGLYSPPSAPAPGGTPTWPPHPARTT